MSGTADLARLAAGTVQLPADAPAPVAFAADELARYLARMFGRRPARRLVPAPRGTWIALTPSVELPAAPARRADCEYTVDVVDGALILAGATPRALLAAAYAVLAAAGCRWSPLGMADEHVPDAHAARREATALASRPAFARRVYAADLGTWHLSMPERVAERRPRDVAFVDWMAKTGATGYQLIRHANDADWLVPHLATELDRRALDVEGGGHALVELLPRSLFPLHPEYFPLAPDARRSDLGNACASSGEGLAVVRERARAASADIPGTAPFHLWGLDLFGGGWCSCTACASLSPSDQALRVCNTAAEGLDRPVFHLAYHDTVAPPTRERPHPRVSAEFAPRERCYGHALDDASCAANVRYRRALEAHLEWFDGRVDVFEYYGDAILFGGCAVPLPAIVARDLAYYARAGVRGVSCLTFGRYSLSAYGVNLAAFARGVLDPSTAAHAPATYCARYAGAAATMRTYLARLEGIMAAVVTAGDLLLPPLEREALASVLRAAPSLRALLDEAAPTSAGRVTVDRRFLDYTLAAVAALQDWLGAADDTAAERAIDALLSARRAFDGLGPDAIGTWGAHDLEITHHFFAATLRAQRR